MDHTAESAAEYLAALGYTITSRNKPAPHAPPADIIRRWCASGKLPARRVGYIWLISQDELDRLAQRRQPDPADHPRAR